MLDVKPGSNSRPDIKTKYKKYVSGYLISAETCEKLDLHFLLTLTVSEFAFELAEDFEGSEFFEVAMV